MPVVIESSHPLLLGSASPRRKQLLSDQGLPLVVLTADVDEAVLVGETPAQYLERVVALKLTAVAARCSEAFGEHGTPAALLVADTAVVVDGIILGKPDDRQHAQSMLRLLAGRTHQVMTRYALSLAPVLGTSVVQRTVGTDVRFIEASEQLLDWYAGSGEGLDKAGAYGIQGIGAFLVEEIRGSWTNVVGLPVAQVMADIRGLGLLPSLGQAESW